MQTKNNVKNHYQERKKSQPTLKSKQRKDLFIGRNMGVVVDDRTKNKLCQECAELFNSVKKGVKR